MKIYEIILKYGNKDNPIMLFDDDKNTKLKTIEKAMRNKGIVKIENALIDATTIGAVVLYRNVPEVIREKDGTYTKNGFRCSVEGIYDTSFLSEEDKEKLGL